MAEKMRTGRIFCTPVGPITWVEYGLMSKTGQLQHSDDLVAYVFIFKFLQEKDVLVLAVGVGKDIDKKELKAIAMNNPDNSFKVSKFKHLRKVLNQVLIKSCRQGGYVPAFYS